MRTPSNGKEYTVLPSHEDYQNQLHNINDLEARSKGTGSRKSAPRSLVIRPILLTLIPHMRQITCKIFCINRYKRSHSLFHHNEW